MMSEKWEQLEFDFDYSEDKYRKMVKHDPTNDA